MLKATLLQLSGAAVPTVRLPTWCMTLTRELCSQHVQPADILVLAGTIGVGGMAPSISTRISARMKCVQGHVSPVNTIHNTRHMTHVMTRDTRHTIHDT